MAAVFGMCFSIEGLLILGFGAVLAQVGQALQHPGAYAVQATLGMVMLVYSIVAGDRKVEQQRMRLPDSQSLGAIFLLGMLINQWC